MLNVLFQLKCCGDNGAFDYGGITLDKSCCDMDSFAGQAVGCTVANAFSGCREKIADFYEKWNKPIAGIAIGIACIEVRKSSVLAGLFVLVLVTGLTSLAQVGLRLWA